VLENLPRPSAVFIGGGASDPGMVEAATEALPPGGRLVVNAVTLASEQLMVERQAMLGGEFTRIAIARAGPLGSKTAWRPALPVTQWTWVKP
jgi:precorrin-6Y C5,15-methyltransferase (decarboxylating)